MLTGLFACADAVMEDAAADGDVAGPSRPSGQAAAQAGPLSRGQREAVLMQMNQILTRQVSLTVDELMAALAAKGLRYGRQAVKQVGLPECMAGGFGHARLQVLSIMSPWLVRGCATVARLSSRWVCLHAWRADSALLLEWVKPIKSLYPLSSTKALQQLWPPRKSREQLWPWELMQMGLYS